MTLKNPKNTLELIFHIYLLRIWIPFPILTLQALQAPQSAQFPSKNYEKIIFPKSAL